MQSNEAICATNMTPERWQQVKAIFNSAIQYEPEERAAFLSRACEGDDALRKEVESLIASHEKEGSFIDSPAYQGAAKMLESDQELKSGQTIGHYEILSTLGRGGMGEVYLAIDSKLGRKVAHSTAFQVMHNAMFGEYYEASLTDT